MRKSQQGGVLKIPMLRTTGTLWYVESGLDANQNYSAGLFKGTHYLNMGIVLVL